MQDRPTAAELLDIARETLLNDILPALPEERRLDALIVANVMAIAGREAEAGDDVLRHELARLLALYGGEPPAAGGRDERAALVARLTRRLAADLRSGAFDGDGERLDQVRAHLLETTRQKLRVNNPRYLAAEGLA